MQKLLLAIFDIKSGVYSNPYTALNNDLALRDFTYACTQESDSELYRYTKDFDLVKIGTYDDTTLEIIPDMQILLYGADIQNLPKGQ
ncbi:MAG: nonstructural protein [Microviridae sp.]|nr:MAG: nonstructural protein [Microviridae sp.]